jgi:hypothetical protein
MKFRVFWDVTLCSLHGAISQTTLNFIFAAMRTQNLTRIWDVLNHYTIVWFPSWSTWKVSQISWWLHFHCKTSICRHIKRRCRKATSNLNYQTQTQVKKGRKIKVQNSRSPVGMRISEYNGIKQEPSERRKHNY